MIPDSFLNVKIRWILIIIIATACVEPINFTLPPPQYQTIVEGMISDSPGPYTVKVSKALDLNTDSVYRPPVENARIKLYDDEGNVENFVEINPGVYKTSGAMRGRIAHSYHIRIETEDGKIFESEPDQVNPVGKISSIRYEFESRKKEEKYGDVQADVFNIYLDADAGAKEENYVRWRFTGTYKVVTNPELHEIFLQVSSYRDPLPCSGYIVTPALGGGKLEKVGECSCCTCWVNQYENLPQLSDVQLVSNNQFKNIKIGEVPITPATFYDKYVITVEQLSLTKKTFDFFKLIRAQKEEASSLFQPPSGEIIGNVHSVNSDAAVVGIFWAASMKSKQIAIPRSNIPYLLAPIYFVPDACTKFYSNATTVKPDGWD
ncbi:MAG: hypothetical protein C0523_04125 [Cytophaga sp.]|nr:hypothetical protein [Cytophaga sp.]